MNTPASPTPSPLDTRDANVLPVAGEVTGPAPSPLKLKSILVPLDFSVTSQKALEYARHFADQFGSKLTLLNVIEIISAPEFATFPRAQEPEKARQASQAHLEQLVRQLGLPASMVERILVRQGTPFSEITEAARTLQVDLIILTTHGHTGLKHVFLGSTAERVVRHAPCPVLTVREKEQDAG